MPHIPDSLHPAHDLELVAAFAAGDAAGPDLDAATALVAACPDCAALHHDLRAIATALPALPAPVRTRDFRITPEQAATLRPRGIRGLLAGFASPRFSFAAPLGTGLAALGIVGVLVASGGMPAGGGTGDPAALQAPGAEAPGGEEKMGVLEDSSGAPASSTDPNLSLEAAPAPPTTGADDGAGDATADPGSGETPGPVLPAAATLVFLGGALIGARLVARALARAP